MIDSYTKLLLHCDGADASTTFIDIALGKAITAVGNAQIDTAQSKFGGASGLFDGTGDYLTTPDHADWFFGTGDFTVDFWARFNALPGASSWMGLFGQYQAGTDYWNVGVYGANWGFVVRVGNVQIMSYLKAFTFVTNTWYHFALVRNGNNFYNFINGTLLDAYNTDVDAMPNLTPVLVIGGNGMDAPFNGWLDEVRISKGIARWTANFTPPTRAYNGVGGGFSGGQPWIFMKDMWEKHNKIWKPRLILPKEGFSY